MDRSFDGVGPESGNRCSNQLNYVPGNLNQEQTAVSVRIGNGKSACVE